MLDGKVVGSIQAGRIRIHSTDDRATITAQAADLQAKEVDITAGNANLMVELVVIQIVVKQKLRIKMAYKLVNIKVVQAKLTKQRVFKLNNLI